ncbi:MAG TPA: sigma-70 family RNA polymerase sigma factor [Solirubrobacterales bacterium]|jgi:RNA polymerase sigma-B factor|nr:sigma-70 family RNA polymerase sigma factor [Solirubrobacterales bacterium]
MVPSGTAVDGRQTRRNASSGKAPGRKPERGRRRVHPQQRAREHLLLRRYAESGDVAVREELLERFMPLARSLALRYRGGREPLDDLLQVANLGLVKAIDGFDPARKKPFTAYAVPTILGELRRHFRDHVWPVHLPRSLQERTLDVDEAITRLTEQFGRFPTVAQIAERLDAEQEDVLDAMRADEARRTLSLDAPRRRDEDDSVPAVETVESEERGYDTVEATLAAQAAGLTECEWHVLRLRFVENLNQYEIGEEIGVSQMQVSRIIRGVLRKLLGAVRGDNGCGPASASRQGRAAGALTGTTAARPTRPRLTYGGKERGDFPGHQPANGQVGRAAR